MDSEQDKEQPRIAAVGGAAGAQVLQLSAKRPLPPVPSGWTSAWDPITSKMYYVETATQKTSWEIPAGISGGSSPRPPPSPKSRPATPSRSLPTLTRDDLRLDVNVDLTVDPTSRPTVQHAMGNAVHPEVQESPGTNFSKTPPPLFPRKLFRGDLIATTKAKLMGATKIFSSKTPPPLGLGKLQVTVLGGTNLQPAEGFATHPYVAVSYDCAQAMHDHTRSYSSRVIGRTGVKRDTIHPRWREGNRFETTVFKKDSRLRLELQYEHLITTTARGIAYVDLDGAIFKEKAFGTVIEIEVQMERYEIAGERDSVLAKAGNFFDQKTRWVDADADVNQPPHSSSRGSFDTEKPTVLQISLEFTVHTTEFAERQAGVALLWKRAVKHTDVMAATKIQASFRGHQTRQKSHAMLSSVVHAAKSGLTRTHTWSKAEMAAAAKQAQHLVDDASTVDKVVQKTAELKSAICTSRRRIIVVICCILVLMSLAIFITVILTAVKGVKVRTNEAESPAQQRKREIVAREESVRQATAAATAAITTEGHLDTTAYPELSDSLQMFGVAPGQLQATVTGPIRTVTVGEAFSDFHFPTEQIAGQRRILTENDMSAENDEMFAMASLAQVVPIKMSLFGQSFDGELITFAQDLLAGTPSASTVPDIAIRLDPKDLLLTSLPVFSKISDSWLGGFRLGDALGTGSTGSLLVASKEILLGTEKMVAQGLNFGGFLQETADNTVAPFITSLGKQAKAGSDTVGGESKLFQYIRGNFPLTDFKNGGSSIEASNLNGGSVEIRFIDTELDTSWMGFPGSTLSVSNGTLHVDGFMDSANTVTTMQCAFSSSIPDRNVLAGTASGVYYPSGAFQAAGTLTTIQLPVLENFILFHNAEIDVAFVAHDTEVVVEWINATATFTCPKLGNLEGNAEGHIAGDRFAWLAVLPGTQALAATLCSIHSSLCGDTISDMIDIGNVEIILSVASEPTVLNQMGLVEQGIQLHVVTDITAPPSLQPVLSAIGVDEIRASASAIAPFRSMEACKSGLYLKFESTHPSETDPATFELTALSVSVKPLPCEDDHRGHGQISIRADAAVRAGDNIVYFAVTATVIPLEMSFSLRGELVKPWENVAGDPSYF
jgi:hypothetical protein